ncbi:MAG TPA: hypothetical protein VI454_04155 [Verrucomicrobiae bacterium]|jgi:hypothetical protein
MNNEHELERLIDRELKQLPPLRAPRTLMPRVLAEVRRRAALPWYQRAWFTWPRQWQVASAVALAAVLVGIAILLPEFHLGAVASRAAGNLAGRVANATEGFGTGLNAALVLWRALFQPVIGYVLVFVAVMFAACAAFGTALGRVLAKELKFA